MKLFLLAVSLVFAITNVAFGETYKWVDEKGVLHIQDHRPNNINPEMKVQKSRSLKDKNSQSSSTSTAKQEKAYNGSILFRLAEEASKKNKEKAQVKVEIYETSWCPYCKKAKNYFRSKGIPFTAYDIEKDEAAAKRKKQFGRGSGVPLVVINDSIIQGYAPALYEKALKK